MKQEKTIFNAVARDTEGTSGAVILLFLLEQGLVSVENVVSYYIGKGFLNGLKGMFTRAKASMFVYECDMVSEKHGIGILGMAERSNVETIFGTH